MAQDHATTDDPAALPDIPDDLLSRRFYTAAQVAQVLQVAPRTVVRWISTGPTEDRLDAVLLASSKGGYRIQRRDLETWLEHRYQRLGVRDQHRTALAALPD